MWCECGSWKRLCLERCRRFERRRKISKVLLSSGFVIEIPTRNSTPELKAITHGQQASTSIAFERTNGTIRIRESSVVIQTHDMCSVPRWSDISAQSSNIVIETRLRFHFDGEDQRNSRHRSSWPLRGQEDKCEPIFDQTHDATK